MKLKYLKGESLKVEFPIGSGKIVTLPAPVVADGDRLLTVLYGFGNMTEEIEAKVNRAIMVIADRLIERAKLPLEELQSIEANQLAFYTMFGIELKLYLPALFPAIEKEEKTESSTGEDSPLVMKK